MLYRSTYARYVCSRENDVEIKEKNDNAENSFEFNMDDIEPYYDDNVYNIMEDELYRKETFKETNSEKDEHKAPGMKKLVRFLNLIKLLDSFPGAKRESIEASYQIMTWTTMCLPVIVGDENFTNEKSALLKFMGYNIRPVKSLWIAGRQFGKSVSSEKFFSAIMILGCASGDMLGVWGQTVGKAKDSIDGIWRRVLWIIDETDYHFKPYINKRTDTDNTIQKSLTTADGYNHNMKAVASSIKSSRGKRQRIIFVDELAFCDEDWYEKFISGLTSTDDRVFIYITTPPRKEKEMWLLELYDELKREQLESGISDWNLRSTVKHCEYCQKKRPRYCPHLQHIVPKFASTNSQLVQLRNTPESKMQDYLTEICGVRPSFSSNRFPPELLNDCIKQERIETPEFKDKRQPFIVSVDPPSHGGSGWGIQASMMDVHGKYVIFATSQLKGCGTDMRKLKDSVKLFMEKVRNLPYIKQRMGLKFIEANNNSYVSQSIDDALGPNTVFPYSNGGKYTQEGSYVLTNDRLKDHSSAEFSEDMRFNRIRFVKEGVYLSAKDLGDNSGEADWDSAIKTIMDQCSKWKWRAVNSAGLTFRLSATPKPEDNDDVIMSIFIGYYWFKMFTKDFTDGKFPHSSLRASSQLNDKDGHRNKRRKIRRINDFCS